MRITTFFSDNLHVDRDGLSKDRRGGSGAAFGGRQGRQNDQDDSQRRSDADDGSSIASLLGQALGQYHGANAFEYSL